MAPGGKGTDTDHGMGNTGVTWEGKGEGPGSG